MCFSPLLEHCRAFEQKIVLQGYEKRVKGIAPLFAEYLQNWIHDWGRMLKECLCAHRGPTT